jgi:hypothetical protein
MRITIIRKPGKPDIEGVSLSHFLVGQEYIVSATLGTVLIFEGWAELVVPPEPAGPDAPMADPPNLIRDTTRPSIPSIAHHRPRGRPRRR